MATIKDVAKRAGVSVATVSRVMNKKGPLSDEAIGKVTEAVKELNYTPNLLARSLASGRNNTIGVILPSFHLPVCSGIAHAIEKKARQIGYSVFFCVMPSANEERFSTVEYMRNIRVNGIVFCGSLWGDQQLQEQLRQMKNMPFVSVIDRAEGIPCVVSDDGQGGILVADHLISKGCKNIVHVSTDLSIYKHADERSYSFMRECEDKGINYRRYVNSNFIPSREETLALVERIFNEYPEVDGMFLKNDVLAAECIRCIQSRGLRIPEDMRVVGYDNMYFGSLLNPPLTTICHDYEKLADTVVRSILDQIEGKTPAELSVIPVELVERGTT